MFVFSRIAKRACQVSVAALACGALGACSSGNQTMPATSPFAPTSGNAAPSAFAQAGNVGLDFDANGDATILTACAAPPPDPAAAGVVLTGAAQVVRIPCFKDFTASADVPANNAKGVEVKLAVSTDKKLGVANAKYGTPIVYTALSPTKTVQFSNSKAAIVTLVASPSQIAAPHTYAMQVYVPSFGVAIQTVTGIKPIANTHEIKFSIVPPGGSFPGIEAVVIVYKST